MFNVTSEKQILTVSQVNLMARTVLEQFAVWIVGDVDEYEDGYKSAVYFKLKDGESVLPAMFWKNTDVGHFPKTGEKVVIFGTLTLYEKTGKYQVKVSKIEPFGEGDLLKKREELRKKLLAEGYFAESIKRPIPELPLRIGLITSKRGAAIEDFLTNVVKNYEGFEVFVADTIVQGSTAVKSICDSFKAISKLELDVVVLTRGGGDIEDLMCFNTEEVVKAIRACPTPVISAVGHEIDYTLADLAADLRVSTPTKAAEFISASYANFRLNEENVFETINSKFSRFIQNILFELDMYEGAFKRVWTSFKTLPEELQTLNARISNSLLRQISNKELFLNSSLEKLKALSPENVLKRGYSISYDSAGNVIKSVAKVKLNDKLLVKVSDGTIDTVVKGKL